MAFMISCKEAAQMVSLSIDGELPFFKRVSLKLHLTMCAYCKRYERQLKYIKELASGQNKNLPKMY